MAKTQVSLSHNPSLKGVPRGFFLPILGIRIASGAGFLRAFARDVQTKPGLPKAPAALRVGLDSLGRSVGLL